MKNFVVANKRNCSSIVHSYRARETAQWAGHSSITNGSAEFIQEAQDALWFVQENASKIQNQKKKRQERELCLNNINLPKERLRLSKNRLDETYGKKFIKRSLENVSTNPYGEFESGQSTLRRSRSLAISREAIFNDLSISTNSQQHRRQQLIPRAKLIDGNNKIKERYSTKEHDIYHKLDRKCDNVSSNYELPHQSYQSNLELHQYRGEAKEIIQNFGLSLPNYYPDSEISLTDLSSDRCSFKDETKEKKRSKNNLRRISGGNIIYKDNISFGKTLEEKYTKPRTIRQYTPFESEFNNFYDAKPRSLPNFSLDENSNLYETATENFSQSDLNFDEINLNNDNIVKNSTDFCFENNPIYDEIPFNTIDVVLKENENVKTRVEPTCLDDNKEGGNLYKTVLIVEDENRKENQKHGHNYLKEFIESQRGSKKPLENFLSKKISRAFGDIKKDDNSTNQYHSLPDLSIGKHLRYCEKIDKKLRNCENPNRFIVNIGKHFDLTAESNIPVDFEVKISKIPKVKRNKSLNKPECFVDAVKNLNTTLKGLPHQSSTDKSQHIKRSLRNKYTKQKEATIAENGSEKNKLPLIKEVVEMEPETNKEYQEKLDTIRNYWGKIAENKHETESIDKEETSKCKIVDVQTKVEEVIKKFENKEEKDVEQRESVVKVAKKIFELNEKSGKTSPIKEKLDIFESRNQYESLNPNSVEIIEKELTDKSRPITESIRKSFESDFDHVRYRVMKSDLFQKNIIGNCQKESQFDGLMQYLRHYSFQELLIDNNIVIIEPIRTNIKHETTSSMKSPKTITKLLHKSDNGNESKESGLRRHFFYHPIRVNKEMNEDELPNPDTVKLVRQLFESGLKKSQSTQSLHDHTSDTCKQYGGIDPNKRKCSVINSNVSEMNENANNDNDDICCEQYVSEDVLKRIRERGTTVTYYGGSIKNKNVSSDTDTKNPECKCVQMQSNGNDFYDGFKFKLLKSNSCSSRIELVGTDNLNEEEYLSQIVDERNRENLRMNDCDEQERTKEEQNTEKQLSRWGSATDIKTFKNININKSNTKSNRNYQNFEKIQINSKKVDDMEFEPYEIAGI
ncbi:hypothetical protein FQR65_LT08374 [Abscondita terminalis]|nr:hypothetical protein FQR65_LT08374 [Abscondita terminalis]